MLGCLDLDQGPLEGEKPAWLIATNAHERAPEWRKSAILEPEIRPVRKVTSLALNVRVQARADRRPR